MQRLLIRDAWLMTLAASAGSSSGPWESCAVWRKQHCHAPAHGETPANRWMNQSSDFSVRAVSHWEANVQLCLPRQFLREQLWPRSLQQQKASVCSCRVGTGETGPTGPQNRGESGKWPGGGGSGGEVAVVVELPLPMQCNQLTAPSPQSSSTPPVARLSPDTAMCVSRDKSSLPTRALLPQHA